MRVNMEPLCSQHTRHKQLQMLGVYPDTWLIAWLGIKFPLGMIFLWNFWKCSSTASWLPVLLLSSTKVSKLLIFPIWCLFSFFWKACKIFWSPALWNFTVIYLGVVSFHLLYLDSVASFSVEIYFFQILLNHFVYDPLSSLLPSLPPLPSTFSFS